MTMYAETPRTASARWRQIFECHVDLVDWGPRLAREERNVPRVPWNGQVKVRLDSKLHACSGIDVSERGIRLAGAFTPELGSNVSMTLNLFGQMVHAAGEVTWVGIHEGTPAVGLRFTVMRGDDRRRLANYVASHVYGEGTKRRPACPWDDGKTLPHGLNSAPPLLPVVPDYVPVRTGHTLAIPVGEGDEGPAPEAGPLLERLIPRG